MQLTNVLMELLGFVGNEFYLVSLGHCFTTPGLVMGFPSPLHLAC